MSKKGRDQIKHGVNCETKQCGNKGRETLNNRTAVVKGSRKRMSKMCEKKWIREGRAEMIGDQVGG